MAAHVANFLACIRGGQDERPNADIEDGHKSTRLCHLGNIALRLGRTLRFDGKTETAIFPGDLPTDPESVFTRNGVSDLPLRFVRFRPPQLERTAEGLTLSLPHIRLDRALEFLLGDRLA